MTRGEAATRFTVAARDIAGHSGSAHIGLDLTEPVGDTRRSLFDLLLGAESLTLRHREQEALGAFLYQKLFESPGISEAWGRVRGAAGPRPLRLTLSLGDGTEPFAMLPWELLRADDGYLFAPPGAGLVRSPTQAPEQLVTLPERPRVLFAWACPSGAGSFDPRPHRDRLRDIFGEALDELPQASAEALGERLHDAVSIGKPYHILHILAHGYALNTGERGLVMQRGDSPEQVPGERLAARVQGAGLRLAFLCACQSGVAEHLAFGHTGTAQRLLAPAGGGVPIVVATQAKLPIAGSVTLMERFYRLLPEHGGDPAIALSRARRDAFTSGGAWMAPILLRHPTPAVDLGLTPTQRGAGLPPRRPTYVPRPACEREGVEGLASARLVSVVGLPGIGKTEVGQQIARIALSEGRVDRVLYRAAHRDLGHEVLRGQIAEALGLREPPTSDEALAAAMERDPGRLLIVIDNAEDMMSDKLRHAALKAQIGAWLQHTRRVRVLLTTRWELGAGALGERRVRVPPMTSPDMDRLLSEELRLRGALREPELESPARVELLALLDGHPRSLMLVIPQLAEPGARMDDIVKRLRTLRERAVADADLLGQDDAWDRLEPSEQARLRSLVASMDLTWEVVRERYPAAALGYRELSLFPNGLPESVCRAVVREDETLALTQLLRMNLVEWKDERTFYPMPLHWYAERKRRLEPVEEAEVNARALDAFVAFARGCDERLRGGDAMTAVNRLLPELPSLELLLVAALPAARSAPWVFLCEASRGLLRRTSRYGVLERLLLRAIQTEQAAGGDAHLEAAAWVWLGELRWMVQDFASAERCFGHAVGTYAALNASDRLVAALTSRARLRLETRDRDGAAGDIERALDAAAQDLNARSELLILRATLRRQGGQPELAERDEEAALAQLTPQDGPRAQARILLSRAISRATQHQDREAELDLVAALELFRAAGDEAGALNALIWLGHTRRSLGKHAEAERDYDGAIALLRGCGDAFKLARTLEARGSLRSSRDDSRGAEADLQEALALYTALDHRHGQAEVHAHLARMFVRQGRLEDADHAHTEALLHLRALRLPRQVARALLLRGELRTRRRELPEAGADLGECLQLTLTLQDEPGQAKAILAIAEHTVERGDLAVAVQLFEDARERFVTLGDAEAWTALALQAKCLRSMGEAARAAQAARSALAALGPSQGDSYASSVANGVLSGLSRDAYRHKVRGEGLARAGESAEAEAAYASALALYQALEDPAEIADCLELLGEFR